MIGKSNMFSMLKLSICLLCLWIASSHAFLSRGNFLSSRNAPSYADLVKDLDARRLPKAPHVDDLETRHAPHVNDLETRHAPHVDDLDTRHAPHVDDLESDLESYIRQRRGGATLVKNVVGHSVKELCIHAHNYVRKLHGVADVTWDDELAKGSEEWAMKLAGPATANLVHSETGGKYGENLYYGSASANIGGTMTPADAVFAWWDESRVPNNQDAVKMYDYKKQGNEQAGTGHFTQVVWKGSVKVGCGVATGLINNDEFFATFVVARYKVAGNMAGAYLDNVLAPKGTLPKASGELEIDGACINKSDNCDGFKSYCDQFASVLNSVCWKSCHC